MAGKVKPKKPGKLQAGARRPNPQGSPEKVPTVSAPSRKVRSDESASGEWDQRRQFLYGMLVAKRREIMDQIKETLGQSLTEDQWRQVESAMDVGDQSLMDLEREMGISLLEMRNRKRQLIDEALIRLEEGLYGICAECGAEISERRLEAVPFAKLCVNCQTRQELLDRIEKTEERG
jgi:DnaK suppressor protein